MSYIAKSLSDHEVVNDIYKLHWISKIPMIIWFILAIPTLGLTLIFAIYEFLKNRTMEHGTTNRRVIYKTGIVSRKTEEMNIKSVETVEIRQSVFGRLFGFGTVKVTGIGISEVVFHKINNPIAVKKSIDNIRAI